MKKDFIVPDKGDAYHIYDKRNSFLQSILEYSLTSGTALSRVTRFSSSGDGRSAWLSLRTWFEGQGSQEAIAKKALETITSHKLTESSNGGAEAFMEKFEGALQELDEIGRSYDHRAEASPFPKNSSQKGRLWTPGRFEYYASSW